MPERREGPTPSLFPLSPRSTIMADSSLRYVDGNFSEAERRDYIVDIFSKAPMSLRNFLNRKAQETPIHSLSHILYRYGNTIALDSVFLERLSRRQRPIKAKKSDIEEYEKIRNTLTGPHWFNEQNGNMQRLLSRIDSFLEHAEPSFTDLMDQILKSETPNTSVEKQLHRKMGFLLGLADGYFPLRYAYERERMVERSD